MLPMQPSLRSSLLTGASALALSVSGSAVHAQTAAQGQGHLPTWTVWAEAAWLQTAGGNFNIPSISGFGAVGAPFTSFTPRGGLEGAFGFDYRFTDQPWHFVFDFRYGKSQTASSNSSTFHSSQFCFFTCPPFSPYHLTSATATHATERESHLVTDFMIGRDLGVGANTPELQLGLRIADLFAGAHANEFGHGTFYSPPFGTVSETASATGSWSSRFFGFGPRAAITGGVPLVGFWTFDYGAGIAGLFGYRTFDFTMASSTGFSSFVSSNPYVFVFNADAWVALSYWFTPYAKLSAGIRTDFYDSALATYNVNTGAFEGISRDYWGPFLRLTGKF